MYSTNGNENFDSTCMDEVLIFSYYLLEQQNFIKKSFATFRIASYNSKRNGALISINCNFFHL